jgi:hypothetical protein
MNIFLLLSAFFCFFMRANAEGLTKEYTWFKQGKYLEVINSLEQNKESLESYILLAKSNFKLEEYQKAREYYQVVFTKSSDENLPLESYYEYAQLNYALDNLSESLNYFDKSYRNKYNSLLSLYYQAVIYHSQNEIKKAHDLYNRIVRSKVKDETDKEVIQAAYTQKAELRLNFYVEKLGGNDYQVKFNNDGEIENYYLIENAKNRMDVRVLSLFKRAIEVNKEGELVAAINSRVQELENKYELKQRQMINGRVVGRTDLTTRLNLNIGYDSNVVTVSDENPTQPEEKESPTGELRAFFRKKIPIRGRYFVNPEFSYIQKYHLNREAPNIFQNDNITVTPAIRMSREHTFQGKDASSLLDLEYSYNLRDYLAEEELKYYNQGFTFSLGERLNYFSFGETSVRLKYRVGENHDEAFNSDTWTLQLSQFFNLSSGDRFIFVTNIASADSETNTLDTNTLSIISNYIYFPRSPIKFVTFYTFGMNLNFSDYQDDLTHDIRGLEVLYTPAISATKIFNTDSKLTLKYAFNYNSSKDDGLYTYDRHVINLDYAHTF